MHLGLVTSSATAIPHDISAAIPSPSVSSFQLGPLTIHFYALCILVGIIIAIVLTNRRLTSAASRTGRSSTSRPWPCRWPSSSPASITSSRTTPITSDPAATRGTRSSPVLCGRSGRGIAIFGSLIGGTWGAWIMCRRLGLKATTLLDALAPGLILAQACGRFGNWFNQELFGLPTTLPWGLEIDPGNPAIPLGTPPGTLFHPTFLYEVIWNSLGALVLLYLGRKVFFQWGRLFAVYLMWYGAGRIVWESIRLDPSFVILGLRTNVWGAIGAVALGVAIMIIQWKRHPEPEESPFIPGREPEPAQD